MKFLEGPLRPLQGPYKAPRLFQGPGAFKVRHIFKRIVETHCLSLDKVQCTIDMFFSLNMVSFV